MLAAHQAVRYFDWFGTSLLSSKRYEIHTTRGPGPVIRGTGIYEKDRDIFEHRAARDGGVAELAAIVARGECATAILLLEPNDPWSDAVENRALKRVCIHQKVRLITTYLGAVRWARFEAEVEVIKKVSSTDWQPRDWKEGTKNVDQRGDLRQLDIPQRSIALISHDKKKLEMVKFVNHHHGRLAKHQRILTTGTTGWLLKLLYSGNAQRQAFRQELRKVDMETRVCDAIVEQLLKRELLSPGPHADLDGLLNRVRQHLNIVQDGGFALKVMPLWSGPEGGDVLIADQVLEHFCHTLLFFQDPGTAHPHNDDIRLLERTCQLPGVFAECVSDDESAEKWAAGLGLEEENREGGQKPNLAQELRDRHDLQEVVLVQTESDEESDALGRALARACAGYLNEKLRRIAKQKKEFRIGIAFGPVTRWVLDALIAMERDDTIEKPPPFPETVVWSPLVGILTTPMTDWEASEIAQGFCDFYGGRVEAFSCAGLALPGDPIHESAKRIVTSLENADVILTVASPWDEQAVKHLGTKLNREYFPAPSREMGTISGVFVDGLGEEVTGDYRTVGLGWEGLRKAAKNGAVIAICGGVRHRSVLWAVLRKDLISVLISTEESAAMVLKKHYAASRGAGGR